MNQTKHIIISVTNDLVTDHRVYKQATTLAGMGYQVTLVGRLLPDSLPMATGNFNIKRFKLLFRTGPLFYGQFNIRLFRYLLFKKADIYLANDLDTLTANRLAGILKGVPVVYDSHEYFTGVPELQNRPTVQLIWKSLERLFIKGVHRMMTVNDSIAKLYQQEYGIVPLVVRNVPDTASEPVFIEDKTALRQQLGLPVEGKLVVLQGAGINIQRGAEEAVRAMQYLGDTKLLIIGGGDVMSEIKRLINEHHLQEKVVLLSKMPKAQLMQYTAACDLGLTLDKDTNINYKYSLPNKLFDYISAGIPVLASKLPEVEKIISEFQIGGFISDHDPKHIAEQIKYMLGNQQELSNLQQHLKTAAESLRWENEKRVFLKAFDGLL